MWRATPVTPAEIWEDHFQPDAPRGVSHTGRLPDMNLRAVLFLVAGLNLIFSLYTFLPLYPEKFDAGDDLYDLARLAQQAPKEELSGETATRLGDLVEEARSHYKVEKENWRGKGSTLRLTHFAAFLITFTAALRIKRPTEPN